MALETLSGFAAADVADTGLKEFAVGAALSAADLNNVLADEQAPTYYGLVAGVLVGGVCTAAGLVVTIPSGTVYLARAVWIADGAVTSSVPDGATTYLWGCSDGVIRQTTTTTPPLGFDERTACVLTKAVASGGTAILDNTVQQQGRVASGHVVYERAPVVQWGWAPVYDTIPSGTTADVPAGTQQSIMDRLQVSGRLTVSGRLRVAAT